MENTKMIETNNTATSSVIPTQPRILYWAISDKEHSIRRIKQSLNRVFVKYPAIKKHYAKETNNPDEQVQLFLKDFFPENIMVNYLAANLSLTDQSEMKIKLSLRAPNHGRFIHLLEQNTAISVSGYWPTKTSKPVFIPENIFISHNDDQPTKYEIEIDVAPSTIALTRIDHNNVLTPELAKNLPLISVKTAKNLNNWLEFINFKRELVKEKNIGLRYLRYELNNKNQLEFTVLSSSVTGMEQASKVFSRKSLEAFEVSISSDMCEFTINDDKKNYKSPRGFELGQIKNKITIFPEQEVDALNKNLESLGIKNLTTPVWGLIVIELNEEWVNKLNNEPNELEQGGLSLEYNKSKSRLLNSIPDAGFISFLDIGDIALINRHERVIKNLIESESCYSPYLSTYLFDIKEAGNMEYRPEIPRWFNEDLQDAQKEAVIKMIGSPDLCLIQGPPGTGKTTVIAEAILQLAARGEKVLLASQAHDAIDNALSRIQNNPELRAIRLARNKDKITEEGEAFTGNQSLARYYDSLKAHTLDTWIKPYQNKIDTLKELGVWLEKAAFIEKDIERVSGEQQQLQMEHTELNKQKYVEQELYTQAKVQYAKNSEIVHQLTNTINQLQNPDTISFIAEGVLTEKAKQVADILFLLAQAQINLTHSTEIFNANPQSHGLILTALFLQWEKVKSNIPQMEHDLLKLKSAGTASLKDPETEANIQRLTKEIKEIEDKIDDDDDDDDDAIQWRALRRNRKQLQNSTQGLNAEIYCIFNDSQHFTNINNAENSAQILEERLSQFKEIEDLLPAALNTLKQELNLKLNTLNLEIPATKKLESITSKIKSITTNIEGQNQHLHQYQAQVKKLLKELQLPENIAFSEHARAIREYYTDSQETFAKEQKLQAPWDNFFKDWVANLSNETAASSDWEHLSDTYIENGNLFAMSCNENSKTLEEAGIESFDVVIIDEVSKATPIEMLLPLMRARRAVLVGDHRQLPPVFQESQDAKTFADKAEETEEDNLNSLLTKTNINRFERMVTASLFKEHFEGADDTIRERLTVQYRMHPEIMQIVNKFYEGQLICGNPEKNREHGITLQGTKNILLTPKEHVLWVDTSCDLQGQRYIEKEGQTNPLEAELIADTLMKINKQMLEQGFNKHNKQKVGVVSFYAAQVREIRQAINRNNGTLMFDAIHVEINTVIRYQGKEKAIILISLVRNDGQAREKRRPAKANVARFEFINVAVSRAQNLLIVFGARNMLECRDIILPSMDSSGSQKKQVYREIFGELDRAARIYPASEIQLAPYQSKKSKYRA